MAGRARYTPEERVARARQQKREFFDQRIARGQCRACGAPWTGPTVNCTPCRRAISAREQARRRQKGA